MSASFHCSIIRTTVQQLMRQSASLHDYSCRAVKLRASAQTNQRSEEELFLLLIIWTKSIAPTAQGYVVDCVEWRE